MHYFPNLFTYKHFPCGVKIMRAASIFILHLLLFILRHYMQRNAMMYLLSNCFSQFSPVSALRAHVRRFLCHTGQEGPPSLAFCQETGWKQLAANCSLSLCHSSFALLSYLMHPFLPRTTHSVNDRGAGLNSSDRWALVWNTQEIPNITFEVMVFCHLSESIVNSLLHIDATRTK